MSLAKFHWDGDQLKIIELNKDLVLKYFLGGKESNRESIFICFNFNFKRTNDILQRRERWR